MAQCHQIRYCESVIPCFWPLRSLIPDPTHISEVLFTIFWVKNNLNSLSIDSNIFLCLLKKINNVKFCEIYGYTKREDTNFFPSSFCYCWIRDEKTGSGQIRIRSTVTNVKFYTLIPKYYMCF
jgi:hypothetical protein